ncbi:MAG: ligase-associated DNA damage response endonuclease PdeM [Sphingomonas sp.]|nr:ligase-associated DNA damage response endonuclease PdeM [Sphingomonas sp.]
MVPFSFAGETFAASPEGAVHWPAQQALLVADLHLEKASWFARLGQFLPPYDSVATLAALTALVASTGARKIYCLGDSFHDRFGCDRLPDQARELLSAMTGKLEWTWILGNHDPGFADHCGGTLIEELTVAGIILRHEADRDDPRPEISGHYHPKYRVNVRGRHVSRRCFVASSGKLILPAFGSLTGGLDASHPEIVKQVGPAATALVPLSDRMLRFPLAA